MQSTIDSSEPEEGTALLVERCLSGEVVLARGFMQHVGAWDLVRESVVGAAQTVSPDVAREIESAGFDGLHDLLTVDELIQLMKTTEQNLARSARSLYRKVLRRGFGHRGTFWVMREPIIRFLIPFDRTAGSRGAIEKNRSEYGEGRLTTLRPHRDIWFAEPSTCINAWISLGTVVIGNGISIFPGDYTTALNHVRDQGVAHDQPVTRPLNVSMNPGDALFFHASHLHASELNSSDRTRTVLSLRFAVEDPALSTHQPERYWPVNPALPVSFWALHPSRRIGRWLQHLFQRLGITPVTAGRVALAERPREATRSPSAALRPHRGDGVSETDLAIGKPLAVSDSHFLVKLREQGEEQIWRVGRRCPHKGADLSLGFVEGRFIRCPWHNLQIDITTGRSACQSLNAVETRRCSFRDGHIQLS